MIDHRVKYRTRRGETVNVLCVEERVSLPLYDYEIVDSEGEVVEHGEILGHTGLTHTAQTRRWEEL